MQSGVRIRTFGPFQFSNATALGRVVVSVRVRAEAVGAFFSHVTVSLNRVVSETNVGLKTSVYQSRVHRMDHK